MKTKLNGFLTLLLALFVQVAFAQEETIRGTVTDDTGMPLPGVNIVIKGTSEGTQTDFDGNYAINASNGDVLVYSFMGLTTVEKVVGDDDEIDVVMTPDAAQLEEVIVTAYGIEREKREVTYQTEKVDSDVLTIGQPTNAANALTGKVAGLQINTQGNGVNPNTQIILRGLRSVTQNNEALIVIDGSVATQGAFNDLNPLDIDDINVLKGATAAALYGADAANGALIVTTKKGQKGDTFRIGLTSTTTLEEIAYMPDFQTEYGTGWQGDYNPIENTNWGPRFDGQPRRIGPIFADGTFQEVPYAPVENNLRDFYDTGVTFQNTVYFSGSTDETDSYYLSIYDQETTGVIPGDNYNKNVFRFNASKKMGDLELAVNSSYTLDEKNVVGGTIGAQGRPLYWFILNTPANIPLATYSDWENDLYASPDGYYNGYYENPYWALDTNRELDNTTRLLGNIRATYEIAEWLKFTGRGGINRYTSLGKNWRAAQTYEAPGGAYLADGSRPNPQTSFVEDTESQQTIYTLEGILTSDFMIEDDYSVKAILGATSYTSRYRWSGYRGNNLSIPGFYDLSNATGELQIVDEPGVSSFVNNSVEKKYGYFADLTLGYKNWLFVNASGRYDFTSTLAPSQNSYFYPGFGVSTVLTDAIPSIKTDFMNYLKLTASHTVVYNDINPYAINELYLGSGAFPFGGLGGFYLSGNAPDPLIEKEQVTSTEFGANLAFFNNRITLNMAYFTTLTNDLITYVTYGPASGADSGLTNIGEAEGTGFEASLGAKVFSTDDFRWDLSFNYTSYETVINEIGATDEIAIATNGLVGTYAIEGLPFPQIQATSYVRDPNGNVVINPNTGNPEAGGLKPLGKTTPDYTLGLTNILEYKGFTLAATFDYRTGHVYYSQLGDAMEFTGRSMESVSANRQDFLFPNSVYQTGVDADGNPIYTENTNIPVTGGRQNFWTNTYNEIKENYVKDATALKLRELSFKYSLPSEFLDKTPIDRLSIGVVGRNLVTWLPAENRFSDPEFNNSTGNSIGIGGYFQGPPTRNYGMTLNVEF